MGKVFSPDKSVRKIDPVILRQIESAVNKLLDARNTLIEEGLPTEKAEFYLRQSKHIIRSVEKMCHFRA
jgi:hypothetical protein